ncbi:MAG: helix-turn-helix transcriptional regulator [Acidimicrobiales bacterium]
MEGDMQLAVGVNLRRLRYSMGFSQESFGEHVGWHRTFVGSVERGERNLTLRTIERIAMQLDVDPMVLLLGADAGVRRAASPAAAAADGEGPEPPGTGPGRAGPGRRRREAGGLAAGTPGGRSPSATTSICGSRPLAASAVVGCGSPTATRSSSRPR